MRAQIIHIIPWETDFIESLARFILEDGQAAGGDLSPYLIVFPHIRPRYYLTERLLNAPELPKPCLLPEMQPLGLLLSRLRTHVVREPLRTAGLLDQVGLLRDCVRQVGDATPGRLGGLPVDDLSLFFPWGCRLAALMEDLFRLGPEQSAPGSLALLEEDAAPFAVALLEQLDNIFAAYVEGLAAASWTTSAQDAWLLGKDPDRALEQLQGRRVILAGFDGFSGVEEQLVRRLWEQGGAEVLLHADPQLAAGHPEAVPHWSCRPLLELCRRWGALPQLYAPSAEGGNSPSLRFYRGFDLHSQLHAMQNELTPIQRSCGERTAVVLTDPGMLLPVLHSSGAQGREHRHGLSAAACALAPASGIVAAFAGKQPAPGRVLLAGLSGVHPPSLRKNAAPGTAGHRTATPAAAVRRTGRAVAQGAEIYASHRMGAAF